MRNQRSPSFGYPPPTTYKLKVIAVKMTRSVVTIAWNIRRMAVLKGGEAKTEIDARAAQRFAGEEADYKAKVKAREEQGERTGKKPRGTPPAPPTPGPVPLASRHAHTTGPYGARR
jgi:hypothetical protein